MKLDCLRQSAHLGVSANDIFTNSFNIHSALHILEISIIVNAKHIKRQLAKYLCGSNTAAKKISGITASIVNAEKKTLYICRPSALLVL